MHNILGLHLVRREERSELLPVGVNVKEGTADPTRAFTAGGKETKKERKKKIIINSALSHSSVKPRPTF